MTLSQWGILACVFLVLSGCTKVVETSGIYLTDAQVDQIQPGIKSEKVIAMFGTPSYTSALDLDFWAYIGTRLETRVFQNPQPIDRRILALDVSGGIVREIIQIDLKDGQQIYPNPNYTPTAGRTISLVEDLFGNIRRF